MTSEALQQAVESADSVRINTATDFTMYFKVTLTVQWNNGMWKSCSITTTLPYE